MIYLVLALLFCHILLLSLSVKADLYYSSENKTVNIRLSLFVLPMLPPVPVFSKAVSTDALARRTEQNNKKDEGKDVQSKNGKGSAFAARFIKNAILSMRASDLTLEGTVDTGDAAVSAVICSAVNIVYSQVCAYFHNEATGGIKPEYGGAGAYICFGGIFCISLTDIIIALCKSVRGAKRRVYERNSAD